MVKVHWLCYCNSVTYTSETAFNIPKQYYYQHNWPSIVEPHLQPFSLNSFQDVKKLERLGAGLDGNSICTTPDIVLIRHSYQFLSRRPEVLEQIVDPGMTQ